jgi:hypothetical protein
MAHMGGFPRAVSSRVSGLHNITDAECSAMHIPAVYAASGAAGIAMWDFGTMMALTGEPATPVTGFMVAVSKRNVRGSIDVNMFFLSSKPQNSMHKKLVDRGFGLLHDPAHSAIWRAFMEATLPQVTYEIVDAVSTNVFVMQLLRMLSHASSRALDLAGKPVTLDAAERRHVIPLLAVILGPEMTRAVVERMTKTGFVSMLPTSTRDAERDMHLTMDTMPPTDAQPTCCHCFGVFEFDDVRGVYPGAAICAACEDPVHVDCGRMKCASGTTVFRCATCIVGE